MAKARNPRGRHPPDRSGREPAGQAALPSRSGREPASEPVGKPAGPSGVKEGERIAKALARAGVASRRDVERYIAEGRVALNGRVLDSPAVLVGPGDILSVDGKPIDKAEATRLFRYHKPAGLLTTHTDPKGRPTVFEALPPGLPRLISVGRLDFASEGLLLLTNDGALSRALELPSSGWVRRYRARARGRITQERLDRLKDGITVEGVRYGPIEARLDKAKEGPPGSGVPANLWITVALAEGKNREVRRVLDHLGLKVNRLIRLAYGPFALATLAPGAVEEVGPRVIRELLAGLIPPEAMPTGERPLFVAPRAPAGEARRRPAAASAKAEGAAPRKAAATRETEPAPAKPKKTYKPGWAKAKAPSARASRPAPKRTDRPRKPREG